MYRINPYGISVCMDWVPSRYIFISRIHEFTHVLNILYKLLTACRSQFRMHKSSYSYISLVKFTFGSKCCPENAWENLAWQLASKSRAISLVGMVTQHYFSPLVKYSCGKLPSYPLQAAARK